MISIIKQLFNFNGFEPVDVNNDLLFSNQNEGKESFWMVTNRSDLKSLNDQQPELLNACKSLNSSSALEKNISMLILWKTSGNLPLKELKKEVMEIEEDPFFFKKYVLYYSEEELESLQSEFEEQEVNEFLQEKISSLNVFNKYKKSPLSSSWESLLYRISMKIPFIEIDIGLSYGLTSLFEENTLNIEKCTDNSLKSIDKGIFDINIDDISSEDYLEKIQMLLEEK